MLIPQPGGSNWDECLIYRLLEEINKSTPVQILLSACGSVRSEMAPSLLMGGTVKYLMKSQTEELQATGLWIQNHIQPSSQDRWSIVWRF